MGLFSKLFGGGASSQPQENRSPFDGPPLPWREADPRRPHGFVNVVGEASYQDALTPLAVLFDGIGRTDRNFAATLQPEPSNAYDPNAVAVQTDNGTTVGYLPREIAKSYHALLAAQPGRVRCWAQLRGGTDDAPSIGVVLDFEPIYALKTGAAGAV